MIISKFTDYQVVRILQEAESGETSQAELYGWNRISQSTFYAWKRVFSNAQTGVVRRLKELEAQNAALTG